MTSNFNSPAGDYEEVYAGCTAEDLIDVRYLRELLPRKGRTDAIIDCEPEESMAVLIPEEDEPEELYTMFDYKLK